MGTRTKGMLKWKVEGHCKGDKLMLEEILNWNLQERSLRGRGREWSI